LRQRGLRVWFDEFELRIGDSLRRKIDQGIARSAFGVVVLSTAFFAKNWAQYELDGLVTQSVDGSQVLLPLWHKLTKAEAWPKALRWRTSSPVPLPTAHLTRSPPRSPRS
jgi:TIR domain-containing protein